MSRSDEIRFGIVIPAYKAAATIVATLDAVAAQSHSPISVVVVIDGPDPELESVVTEHRVNSDVIVLPENSGGPATPRNVGAAWMTDRHEVDAIWFLDDDDLPSAEFLGTMNGLLQTHPNTMLACSSFRNWNDGSPRGVAEPDPADPVVSAEIDLDWYLHNTGAVLPSFSVVRVAALDLLDHHGGRFRPELTNNQDYEVFVRLIHLAECRHADWCGGDYRITNSSISANGDRAWSCRERADLMLGAWFDSKSLGEIGREFRKRSRSAGRRAARERWHAGDRLAVVKDLLRRGFGGLDLKAVAVLVRMGFGLDRRPERVGG
ncbi:MAG: glycosyltransferase family 2 protein [Phycisphaeraceae bacterium]|nr:glycosyltransferase family 2 protein [Phycisphaeraceae bacterium]